MKIHDYSATIEVEQKPYFDVKNRCLEFPQIMGAYDWKKLLLLHKKTKSIPII